MAKFSLADLKKGKEFKPDLSIGGGRKKSSTSIKSLKQNFRPKHIDEKLSQLESKIVSSSTYYTSEGVKFVTVYDEEGKFKAKIFDVEYTLLNEDTFDSLEECGTCIAELMEDINLEDSPMLTVIKDVMKRVNLATDEMLFVFRLLTDPNERDKYLDDSAYAEEEEDEPVKRKVIQPQTKKRGRPPGNVKKQSFLDSLMGDKEKKMGSSIKDKIKTLNLTPADEDY